MVVTGFITVHIQKMKSVVYGLTTICIYTTVSVSVSALCCVDKRRKIHTHLNVLPTLGLIHFHSCCRVLKFDSICT